MKKHAKPLTRQELAAVEDKDIDFSDIPEMGDDFWDKAKIVHPHPKKQLTVRFDEDVVDWFKSQGRGYQTRMNAVLRSYYETQL